MNYEEQPHQTGCSCAQCMLGEEAHRRLIADAATAAEIFGEDELEKYAQMLREKGAL